MTDYGKGLNQALFCELTDVTKGDLLQFCRDDYPLLPGIHLASEISLGKRLAYADALAIFVARQFGDDWGIPLGRALRLTAYAGSIRGFLNYQPTSNINHRALNDFWAAILQITFVNSDFSKSGIGPKEERISGHYTGPLHQVSAEIAHRISTDETALDGEPTRVLLVNVSAADRRLRQRAKELGIVISGSEFEATNY